MTAPTITDEHDLLATPRTTSILPRVPRQRTAPSCTSCDPLSQPVLLYFTPHVPQRTEGTRATLVIDHTGLVYSHTTGLRDRYLRYTRVLLISREGFGLTC